MTIEKKRWLVLLPLLALLVLLTVTLLKPSPKQKAAVPPAPLVNTISVQNQTITPFVIGYGRARPKQTWQSISEVSGRVIYRHPMLERGQILTAGTELLKVDPTDYELKLAQTKSDLSSAQAELKRIQLNEDKLQLSLKLEKQQLASLQKELVRKQGLSKQGSVAQSSVDLDERNLLVQQQKVLDIENSIKQFPFDLAVAQSKVEVNQARLAEAQLKLDKTIIRLPFDARIASIDAEPQQLIKEGQLLLEAHMITVMEVPVQVPMSELRNFSAFLPIPEDSDTPFASLREANVGAEVSLQVGTDKFSWPGRLTSVGESINSQGNTLLMMVEVDMSQKPPARGKQPPLINDMYVQVTINGTATELPVIPVDAVHGDRVYLLSDNSTLEIKHVDLAFEDAGQVAVLAGLSAGDKLITSDVIPPINGIVLRDAGAAP